MFISPSGAKVLSLKNTRTIAAGTYGEFDQLGSITNPVLWYPNNSAYGKPQLHRVVREVAIAGKIVDSQEAKCGLRVIDWTGDYCLINGRKHLFLGYGSRNIYPALGQAVPAALQWQDIALIAQSGGNCLRIGHLPTTQTMLDACDAYGVLVMQESGDNEWALKNEPALTYKRDFDQEMMISSRNHPSVLLWESNNGLAKNGDIYWPSYTKKIADENDFIRPRIVGTRDNYPTNHWDPNDRLLVGRSNTFRKVAGSPSLNVEVYGAVWNGGRSHNMARDDYADEKEFCTWFINDYLKDINGGACGWIDWMLAETQGEGYTIYLNGMAKHKSLGSCAMDGNRFPKLLYEIYCNALWIPFDVKPGVVLQSQWNLGGTQDVCAWSNCPKVELFLNGKSLGICEPNPNTKYCEWPGVIFAPGILKAVGLDDHNQTVCESVRETAGAPDHIVLKVELPTVHPGGITFPVRANGSDAAIVTAMVVDKEGRWCPLATNALTFAVSGEGDYRGSYNFYVTPGKPPGYHAPGDHELAAEGGLMRVAIRSTFKPGQVDVTCESPGLGLGKTSYATLPQPN
jgi:beta-galactosidase